MNIISAGVTQLDLRSTLNHPSRFFLWKRQGDRLPNFLLPWKEGFEGSFERVPQKSEILANLTTNSSNYGSVTLCCHTLNSNGG